MTKQNWSTLLGTKKYIDSINDQKGGFGLKIGLGKQMKFWVRSKCKTKIDPNPNKIPSSI